MKKSTVLKLTFHTVIDNNNVITPFDQVYYINIFYWDVDEYKQKLKESIENELPCFLFDDDCDVEVAEENDYKDKYILNYPTLRKFLLMYTYYDGKNPYVDANGKELPSNKYTYEK